MMNIEQTIVSLCYLFGLHSSDR